MSIDTLKKTPLTEVHIKQGAKMAEYAGYHMPLVYTSISEEHMAVRKSCGMFDVSHMGQFIIKGTGAEKFLDFLTSNAISSLKPGEAQYTLLLLKNGGIVDDLIIYRLTEEKCNEGEQAYMMVVNAANIDKDWDYINKFKNEDVHLENISSRTGILAIQGPKAAELLSLISDEDLSNIKYYHHRRGTVAGLSNIIISATGYTGSGGFELYGHNEDIKEIWTALMNLSRLKPAPCGLGSRDTLRLEAGYCLYGNELRESVSPYEAGLGWITKINDKENVAKKTLKRIKKEGPDRKLIGFKILGNRVPRPGYGIVDSGGKVLGFVTSGTHSPMLDQPIGMGYITAEAFNNKKEIAIDTGRKFLDSNRCKMPFVKLK